MLHNGTLTRDQYLRIALINSGPRAVLTSFTAATVWGLENWSRSEIHILVPAGTKPPPLRGVVHHLVGDWSRVDADTRHRLHRLEPALLLAAASFPSPRPACGIIAAAVQQRLTTAARLQAALAAAARIRHRAALVAAVADIGQGAHALSEIDFRRLCRRFRLPAPTSQAVRVDAAGRRRYLDAEWVFPDGRRVAVEVDGAHHLSPLSWWDDQYRQNEIVLGDTIVLRFPSVTVRDDPYQVAGQLARALKAPFDRRDAEPSWRR